MISKDQVKHVAELARLTLTQEEVGQYQADLNEVLQAAEKLRKFDTLNVSVTTDGTPFHDIGRNDVVKQSLEQVEALHNGPQVVAGHFRVPKIMGDE